MNLISRAYTKIVYIRRRGSGLRELVGELGDSTECEPCGTIVRVGLSVIELLK